MPEPTTTESARRELGAVEALARDDLERKKFLTMAGRRIGAGAAAYAPLTFVDGQFCVHGGAGVPSTQPISDVRVKPAAGSVRTGPPPTRPRRQTAFPENPPLRFSLLRPRAKRHRGP